MPDIICKCGSVNNYRTEQKANNQVAYCNVCGAYIKNLPYDTPRLYIGKYKGIAISEITDIPYLKWALDKLTLSANVRQAIQNRIKEYEFLAK